MSSASNFDKFRSSKRFLHRLEKMRRVFEDLKKTVKTSTVSFDGWKKFNVNRKGEIAIRCQAIENQSNPPSQCKINAIIGKLTCKYHGGARDKITPDKIAKREKLKDLGIYDVDEQRQIRRELQAVGDIDEEKLRDVSDELKLAVALLRRYLRQVPDATIAANPNRLFWLLDNVVRFKKTHWDMKHAPEVSFSREQVEFLFIKVRSIVLESVKDTETLNKISEKIQVMGVELRAEGFQKK